MGEGRLTMRADVDLTASVLPATQNFTEVAI